MQTRQCLSLTLHILTTYVEIDYEIILDKGKIANVMNEDKKTICLNWFSCVFVHVSVKLQ